MEGGGGGRKLDLDINLKFWARLEFKPLENYDNYAKQPFVCK